MEIRHQSPGPVEELPEDGPDSSPSIEDQIRVERLKFEKIKTGVRYLNIKTRTAYDRKRKEEGWPDVSRLRCMRFWAGWDDLFGTAGPDALPLAPEGWFSYGKLYKTLYPNGSGGRYVESFDARSGEYTSTLKGKAGVPFDIMKAFIRE